jgi:hypothetical protein
MRFSFPRVYFHLRLFWSIWSINKCVHTTHIYKSQIMLSEQNEDIMRDWELLRIFASSSPSSHPNNEMEKVCLHQVELFISFSYHQPTIISFLALNFTSPCCSFLLIDLPHLIGRHIFSDNMDLISLLLPSQWDWNYLVNGCVYGLLVGKVDMGNFHGEKWWWCVRNENKWICKMFLD